MEAAGVSLCLQFPGESRHENPNALWSWDSQRFGHQRRVAPCATSSRRLHGGNRLKWRHHRGSRKARCCTRYKSHPSRSPRTRTIAVNPFQTPFTSVGKDGGLQNVEVFLKGITKGKALLTDTISLVNEHCMFNPRVQGANFGQQIKISSNDPVLHSTHPQNASTNATIYNIALPFKGFSVTKPLPAVPELIKVKCDAHDWMHAWIWEFDNPYFATTGDDGHFTIKDVPPGPTRSSLGTKLRVRNRSQSRCPLAKR